MVDQVYIFSILRGDTEVYTRSGNIKINAKEQLNLLKAKSKGSVGWDDVILCFIHDRRLRIAKDKRLTENSRNLMKYKEIINEILEYAPISERLKQTSKRELLNY